MENLTEDVRFFGGSTVEASFFHPIRCRSNRMQEGKSGGPSQQERAAGYHGYSTEHHFDQGVAVTLENTPVLSELLVPLVTVWPR